MARYVDTDKMLANICAECLDKGTDECKNGNCTERNWINDTPTEDVQPMVHDDKWSKFRSFMYNLHEMRNEGCRGCEEPPTTCRKCMQDYYWLNIKYYL